LGQTGSEEEKRVMCQTPAQLNTDLKAATQAQVISLSGINPINCPTLAMTGSWTGGKLFFSDSPETPTSAGKLYFDTSVPATVGTDYHRIFLYHVNGKASGKMKFSAMIKNTGTASATLTVQKIGTSGPTTSFLYAGKLAYQRWLVSTAGTPRTVAPGAWIRVDTSFDALQASPGNLLHGIWDYKMDQPHEVLIVALNQNDDPISVGPGLPLLARDTHDRGTFPFCDKVYDTDSGVTFDTAGDIKSFPIGGGTSPDDFAVGMDTTDGTPMTLAGNFGVNYKIHVNTISTDGKNIGIMINPRGGQWGGAVWAMAGVFPSGKILIPPTTASTGDNTKGAVEGKYVPGAGLTIWAQFMPTGGSSFPVRCVLVPYTP